MAIYDTSKGEIIPESQAIVQVESSGITSPVLERPEDNCAFVIFGASGDLTGRKLIPALYNLYCQDLLPPGFAVIGFAITPMTDESFRESMREWVRKSPEVLVFRQHLWNQFVSCLHYITGDFENPAGFRKLRERLDELDSDHVGSHNAIYYLATAPSFYALLCQKLGEHGFVERGSGTRGWMRVVIEKPFGHDLESARRLNESIHTTLDEDKIYRIDHYLGKETVRNILAFRFANSIMEPIWNNRYIDHVQITACEQLGVEHRGRYYEEAGCIRDMFQNHLFQLLALVAMEPPVRYDKYSVRDRKGDVLRAVVPLDCGPLEDSAVRGQYGPGKILGEPVLGYREEPDVSPQSNTDTYAALKLKVDNWRWADVPFYIRSGKRMPRKLTQLSVQFKRVPHMFFAHTSQDHIEPNVLTIRIQPDEGISLQLGAKAPGPEMHIHQVMMNFSYNTAFGEFPATAYETLLLDAMHGDPTLFNRSDTVELAWDILKPVLDNWGSAPPVELLPNYPAGSWGPSAADDLLTQDGRTWKNGDSSTYEGQSS